jgi:chromosomal replication initiation ATPase DnaA
MEQAFSPIVKKEIIRAMLMTHGVVLVVGWPGAGKTFAAIQAGNEIGEVYYYNGKKNQQTPDIESFMRLQSIGSFKEISSDNAVLIVDDMELLDETILSELKELVIKRMETTKIVLICRTMLDAKDFLDIIDAVVRVSKDTAKPVFTKLRDIKAI